jgi:hypothetical protein
LEASRLEAATNDGTLLMEGTRVRIKGLVDFPELNGQEGTSVGASTAHVSESGVQNQLRYVISIVGTKTMLLKSENVEMLRIKQPMFENIDDMMADIRKLIGEMGLDPDTFANTTPKQKQKMFKMTKKLDRYVHVAGHWKLRFGVDCPSPDIEDSVAVLEALVPYYLSHVAPDFNAAMQKAVADAKDSDMDLSSPKSPQQKPPTLILDHQALFAAGYDGDEYTLLGMALKYAGLHGVNIEISGRNIYAKESRVVDLLVNTMRYFPETVAQIRNGKLGFWSWGIYSAGTYPNWFLIPFILFLLFFQGTNLFVGHQDSFAAGYHDDEYTLLGIVVKYYGLHGLGVHIIGRNHETF